jgi:hypothetical protein
VRRPARNHLKQLFARTGISGQAELVARVLSSLGVPTGLTHRVLRDVAAAS